MNKYILSLDESGQSDPKTYKHSPYFVLSGIMVKENDYSDFKEHLNQVKYATWKEDWKKVLLRSSDIGRGNGVFRKLYNTSTSPIVPNEHMTMFCRDLRRFFKRRYFSIMTCLINKEHAVKTKIILLNKGKKSMKYVWDQKMIYKICYEYILNNFVLFLTLTNSKGKIIAEASSDQQDIALYKQFFRLQSEGLNDFGISHKDVKDRLSSLSFVTKINRDSEEEIADLMGYATRVFEEIKTKLKSSDSLSIYDRMILQARESNSLTVSPTRSDPKMKRIAKAINSYIVIP